MYVQYGCGFSCGDGWQNFDSSPTLRMERMFGGSLVSRLKGNRGAFPKAVKYGDIVAGLPVQSNSANGVYASHVLEHLSLEDFWIALKNTFDILKPGGEFRLIVPDMGARAKQYVAALEANDPDANSAFLRETLLGREKLPRGTASRLTSAFGGSSHLWMWDEPSMTKALASTGFVDVRRCGLNDSSDPMFKAVEDPGRFTAKDGTPELAMSARKPENKSA